MVSTLQFCEISSNYFSKKRNTKNTIEWSLNLCHEWLKWNWLEINLTIICWSLHQQIKEKCFPGRFKKLREERKAFQETNISLPDIKGYLPDRYTPRLVTTLSVIIWHSSLKIPVFLHSRNPRRAQTLWLQSENSFSSMWVSWQSPVVLLSIPPI